MRMDSSNPLKENIEVFELRAAEHCGLSVEVVCRMEHCSLIRYRDREFVIITEDLCFQQSMRCAA